MATVKILNVYNKEIYQLFRAESRIMVLLSLYNESKSLSEIEKLTEIASSSVITNSKLWIDYGLVQKNNNNYNLTTMGQIITLKIISLLKCLYPRDSDEDSGVNEYFLRLYYLKKDTINEIMRSHITIELLLHLENGVNTRKNIKNMTGATTQVISSKIKWLVSQSFITEDNQGIRFTPSGTALIAEIKTIIFTYAAIIKHKDYWKVHLLKELPDFALQSIGDLVYTKEIHDTPEKPFQNYENWMNMIGEAEYLHSISNYATPNVSDAITKRVIEGVPMDIIISPSLAQEIFTEKYKKNMKILEDCPNLRWFVCEIPRIFGVTVTDKCFTIKFSFNNLDYFDTSAGLLSRSKEAREWGERLFNYYKARAVPIFLYLEYQKTIKIRPNLLV